MPQYWDGNSAKELPKKLWRLFYKMNIGIIGKGFVGTAVKFGFSPNVGCDANVRIYDKNPSKSSHTIEEVVNESDFVFISFPLLHMKTVKSI